MNTGSITGEEEAAADGAPGGAAAPAELNGKGEWLVVGEDEEPVRRLLAQTLEARGYHVLEARDGVEVLQTCAKYRDRIALVVCDVCMPYKGGLEVEEELRAASPAAPPVLFVTGYADVADTMRAAGKEIELLLKPVPTQELLRRARKMIDARRPAAPGEPAPDA